MKHYLVYLLTLMLILMFPLSSSAQQTPTAQEGGEFPQTSDPQQFQDRLNSGQSVSANTQYPVTLSQEGQEITVQGRVSTQDKEINAEYLEIQNTEMQNVEGFHATSDGYTLDGVERLTTEDGVTLIGAEGVEFKNGILTAQHADSFIKDGSVSTNIDNLNSTQQTFSVQKADSFISDKIRIDSIKDSEFKVSDDKVEITTKSDVDLKITDSSYNEVEFKGKGKVTIDKKDNPDYILENGSLTISNEGYNETIESNNSAIIETDKTFGFKCVSINPVGSYFYNDKDLRKDFVINIPKESPVYRLCLRKNQAQQFSAYNGLVDFIDKKIELNGIVNYLRYPLKNNQIASLLSDFVYRGLQNVRTLLAYDNDLLFLNNAAIKNILENKQQITITKPNNHITVKELELEDGKIHRIAELSKITKSQLNQDVLSNYESDSLGANIAIKDNVLVQDNGENRITILPRGIIWQMNC